MRRSGAGEGKAERGTFHPPLRLGALEFDLQPKLNFPREILLARDVAESAKACRDLVALENRTVLIAALIEAENRTVEDVEEIRTKFDIH